MTSIFKLLYACILACLIICQSNYSAPIDNLRNKYNLNISDHCKCLYNMVKPYLSPELLAKYGANQENITIEDLTEIAKHIEENIETSPESQAPREIEFLRHIKHSQYPLDGSFTWGDIEPVLEKNKWQLKSIESETPNRFKIVKNRPDILTYSSFSKKDLQFLTDELALSVDQIFSPLINKTEDNFKETPNTNMLEVAYFTLRIILGESPLERYIEQKSKATIPNQKRL